MEKGAIRKSTWSAQRPPRDHIGRGRGFTALGQGKAMSNRKKSNYEIGYGKTPVHTRYKKGESGNPGGKRKTADKEHDVASTLDRVVHEQMTFSEGGTPRRASKEEVNIRRSFHKTIKGDLKA